jgi:hypothetical protein
MNSSTPRSIFTALTLAIALTVTSAMPALAQDTPSTSINDEAANSGELAASEGTKRFADVPQAHKFYTPIMWMYATGLSTGTKTSSGAVYLPSDGLSREAMAAFLYRQAGRPAVSGNLFADVPAGYKFAREIRWMRAAKITTGFADGTYRPKDGVSREAMAAFLYRQAGSPGVVESGSLSITGSVSVGKTVTATMSGWLPSRLDVSYQWLANGKPIAGATAATLSLDESLLGKSVQVKVVAKTATATPVQMTSAASVVEPKGLDPVAGTTPTIQGVAQVDKTVTVNVGAWDVAPTVTWLIDGKSVGTGTSLTLTAAHAKKKLTVRATASAPGFATTTLTSSARTVALGKITGTKPVIDGSYHVAETVSANIGTWSVQPKLYWVINLTEELSVGGHLNPDNFGFVGRNWYCDATCTMPAEGDTMSLVAIADAPGYERMTMVSEEITSRGLDTAMVEQEIHRLVNDWRVSQGLPAMVRDDRLSLGARTWVQQLNASETFTHSTKEWRNQYASTTWGTGENLFQACGNSVYSAAKTAETAYVRWLGSPDHLKNIKTSSWDTTGIGVDVRKQSSGLWCVTSSQIFENR